MPATADATHASNAHLSMHKAAAALGLTRHTLLVKVGQGAIEPVQFGGRLWFRAEDVNRLAEALAVSDR